MTLLGNFNTADGLLNDPRFTTFAIGTGTSAAARGTAFHVSASGMTTVNVGLNVRGNQTGSTELEVRETGVKIGNLSTDSHNLTGSFSITGSQTITGSLDVNGGITGSLFGNATSASFASTASFLLGSIASASYSEFAATASFLLGSIASASFAETSATASFATNFVNSGSYVITGSHRGNVVSQSIASSTASFDFSTGNFFTLNLTGSTLTHISASNVQQGQTVNIRITQGATTGSVSFSPVFKQVSGSAYVPTQVANAVDVVTFITFDNTNVYVSNIKNLV
jgi:hypothetical protein